MQGFDLGTVLRPELGELAAYVPDLGEYAVRLDANEAPPVLSAAARERLAHEAVVAWERYPDPTARELRRAVACRCGVGPESVLVGVGSDEVIAALLTACVRPRGRQAATVLTTTPTFVMYRMSARVRGLEVIEVPLDAAWDLDVAGMMRAIEFASPNLVFIASPNNPTGNRMSPDRLERVIEAASGAVVVIDEAYIDYASQDQLGLYHRHPNVAILRTLSKTGFASLRVGWLIGRPELVAALDKVRLPYNVNAIAQRLATFALDELGAEMAAVTHFVCGERGRLFTELAALDGVEPWPSEANFIWIRTTRPANEVHAGLCTRGVLARSFHQRGGRLAHQLRVTVGTARENDTFLRALREVL
ncbi:MAG: histidinol-phosphate transaminase [Polyangiaceae bacterium]|nr:histidinol-phosphate transaminase [Polyangiaceae bacterium]